MPVENITGGAGKYSHCETPVDQTPITEDYSEAPEATEKERNPYFDIPMWRRIGMKGGKSRPNGKKR